MSDSKTAVVAPITTQIRKRVWLDEKGCAVQEAAPAAIAEPVKKRINWLAHVADTGTGEKIDELPELEGSDELSSAAQIEDAYIQKCRFLDGGTAVDVTALKQNVNGGLWEIVTKIVEPDPGPSVVVEAQ